MTELWKDIPGIPSYQASTLGNVRSMQRTVRIGHAERTVGGVVLKAFVSKTTRYYQVALRGRRYSVHRLVALAWCDGYFDGAVVDHINNDRGDNRACNLQWVTRAENARRSFKFGRARIYAGKYSAEHPTAKSVVAICMRTGAERFYASAMDAVREGFDSSSISRCCNGLNRSHKGHFWRFALTETRRGGFIGEAA